MKRTLLLSFSLATIGCSVDLPAGQFSCESNVDCLSGSSCILNVCREGPESRCVDDDGDGFGPEGANECDACLQRGLCAPDCDDTNDAVNPGESDICDGVDNDCSGVVDQAHECKDLGDCPEETGLISRCDGGSCAYYAPLSLEPGCGDALACSGVYEVPPGCS